MGTFQQKRSGFTLIELLVVVIIIAVLAAVGVPLLSANILRSQMTEAETGLGTIRTQIRAYGVENNALPPAGTFLTTLGFSASDFAGQFFSFNDYSLPGTGGVNSYCIAATGNSGGSTAPSKLKVSGKTRSMNQDGTIFKSADCT